MKIIVRPAEARTLGRFYIQGLGVEGRRLMESNNGLRRAILVDCLFEHMVKMRRWSSYIVKYSMFA